MPTERPQTWAEMSSPSAALASSMRMISRQSPGCSWLCASDTDKGLCEARTMALSTSKSWRGSEKPATTCSRPALASLSPMAISTNSSVEAWYIGVFDPSLLRWFMVREVENPTAPARMASCTSARIALRSAAFAGSRRAPRSPIAYTRSAACGTYAQTSMSYRRWPRKSRYCGKLSQHHGRPSVKTISGISSTPSIRCTRVSRSVGRHGAKPTPQFPRTTVVTPCADEGRIRSAHVTCPS